MQTRGWISLPENHAARQAVERVAACLAGHGPRREVNPLLLHGPPGTGKTRLVEELASLVGLTAPDLIVRTLPASEFATLDEEAALALREADLVIVEDVQHTRAAEVESLVRLLDRSLNRHRQLVLTASAGPAQLTGLPGRLTSRLACGLVVALSPLSPGSRREYLCRRIEERGLKVGGEVVSWLAANSPGSARRLEGAITRVERLAAALGRAVTPGDLGDLFAEEAEAHRPTLERIARQVGRYFAVEPRQMCSEGRSRAVLLSRQVGMYLARRLTDLSLEQIGAYFGGRDHSTVLHACRKVEQAITADVELGGAVRRLHAELA